MICLSLLLAASGAHPDSESVSRLVVDDARARLVVRCQLLSLGEVVPGLEPGPDGLVARSAVEARREEILDYVGRHYVLRSGGGPDVQAGRRLVPRPVGLTFGRRDGRQRLAGYDLVDIELAFEDAAPIRTLSVAVDLFRETSPGHRDQASIVWNGRAPLRALFRPGASRWAGAAPPPVGRAFLGAGWRRGLVAWVSLAFLAALLLGARGAREGACLAALFAAAQFAGLAPGALGLVPLDPRLVGLAATLSVAYLGADNLMRRAPGAGGRPRWLEAALFGLLHGARAAVHLRPLLDQERERIAGLVAFEAGLFAAQTLFVLVLLLLLARLRPRASGALAPPWARAGGSLAVLLLGLFAFAHRAAGP